ncbi:MAG: hypothetical protein JXR14_00850 [Paracoccaceae bacterium]
MLPEIKLKYLIVLLFFTVFSKGVEAQVQLNSTYDTLNSASVLFIPGVMGSSLTDEETGKRFWADLTTVDDRLFFRDNAQIVASPLDHASVFGLRITSSTYGDFLADRRRALSTAENFHAFGYDWRASNVVSASKLAEFVCKEFANDTQPLIIVAHSMGGLVFKLWIQEHYHKGCEDGELPEIGRIFFVGTPHLGAPLAFSHLINEIDLFGFKPVDDVIAKGINKFGLSFASLYELMPMTSAYERNDSNKRRCVGQELASSSGPYRHRVLFLKQDRVAETLDIFDTEVLARLGVVDRVAEMLASVDIEADPKLYLEERLNSARAVICKLSTFVMPAELRDKVRHLYGMPGDFGQPIPSTVSEVIIAPKRVEYAKHENVLDDPAYPGKKFYIYVNRDFGDGTVPADIAGLSIKTPGSDPISMPAKHLELLRHSTFVRQLLTAERELHASIFNSPASTVHGYDLVFPRDAYLYEAEKLRWGGSGFLQAIDSSQAMMDVDDGVISLKVLRSAEPSGKLLTGATQGTIWDAEIWPKILATDATPSELILHAERNPSGLNWHVLSSISDLTEEERVLAKSRAAQGYIFEGSTEIANVLWKDMLVNHEDALAKDGPSLTFLEFLQYAYGDDVTLYSTRDIGAELALRQYVDLLPETPDSDKALLTASISEDWIAALDARKQAKERAIQLPLAGLLIQDTLLDELPEPEK